MNLEVEGPAAWLLEGALEGNLEALVEDGLREPPVPLREGPAEGPAEEPAEGAPDGPPETPPRGPALEVGRFKDDL
mgnify:CR=1 FL=1